MIPRGERVEVFKGDPGRKIGRRWYMRQFGGNGEVVASGEAYTRRRSAIIAGIKAADGRMPVYAAGRGGSWQLERGGSRIELTFSDAEPDQDGTSM